MNNALAQAVVQSLSFSGEAQEKAAVLLPRFAERDWDRSFCWLDNSGLALYFLRRLEETQRTSVLPARILARLQRNQSDNQHRLMRMAEEFARINCKFDEGGLNYAVMKGFSLVPAFSPDASLRAQADLDYMLDDESLPGAQRILRELGYTMTQATGTQFVFRSTERAALLSDSPYALTTPPMVELHLAVWEEPKTRFCFRLCTSFSTSSVAGSGSRGCWNWDTFSTGRAPMSLCGKRLIGAFSRSPICASSEPWSSD
jgi:hypothetical protein